MLDDKYVFFGRTSVVITPVRCKMTKYYFYDSFLRFRYTLSLIVDSVDPGTQHLRSYSYAGNKGAFQVFNTNLVFSSGKVKRISLRNENQNLPVLTTNADFGDWSKSIVGGWAGVFGNVVDKKHMTHPLPLAQK